MRKMLPLALLVFLASIANFAFGQAITASSSLAGTVSDKSGAVVVGATITATDTATNTTRTETTNSLGAYRFDVLPPGAYTVKVNMKGFASASAANVELLVSRTTTQDFR